MRSPSATRSSLSLQERSTSLRGITRTNVAGLPTSFGIPHFSTNIPKTDSVAVARLKAAGAVIFGKTNVPADLSDWQSYNQVYGSTGNPWNLAHSPGGWDRRITIDDVTIAHDEQLFWSGITGGFYLPSTVAPIVRSKNGLPIGVQIVARCHGDRTTIAVAALIEVLNGGFTPSPQ